jgi:hypothetical protein
LKSDRAAAVIPIAEERIRQGSEPKRRSASRRRKGFRRRSTSLADLANLRDRPIARRKSPNLVDGSGAGYLAFAHARCLS